MLQWQYAATSDLKWIQLVQTGPSRFEPVWIGLNQSEPLWTGWILFELVRTCLMQLDPIWKVQNSSEPGPMLIWTGGI